MKCTRRCLIRIFAFGIFALVALIARNFVLMDEARRSRLVLNAAYSNALEQLSDSCRNISETLEKELYAGSDQTHKSLSVKLYQQACDAKNALSQLPMGDAQTSNTNKFLSQVGNYSLAVGKKLDKEHGISDKDYENISKLFEFSKRLAQSAWELESSLNAGEIDFDKAKLDDSGVPVVTDGFSDFEESFDDYPTLIYDGPFSDNIMQKKPKMTENAKEVSKQDALEKCRMALNISTLKLENVSEVAGNMPSWRFSDKDQTVCCEVTKRGGYLSYFLKSRLVDEEKMSKDQALKTAEKYLDYLGILSVKSTYYEIKNGIMTVNYAYDDLGTCVYTDLVKVSVAMDNGEIIGYDARGFLVNHTKRDYPKKLFSKLRAQQRVSPKLTVQSSRMAVIPGDNLEEKLCYEFKCKAKNGRNVLVYYNAQTGEEERILLLVESPSGTLTV